MGQDEEKMKHTQEFGKQKNMIYISISDNKSGRMGARSHFFSWVIAWFVSYSAYSAPYLIRGTFLSFIVLVPVIAPGQVLDFSQFQTGEIVTSALDWDIDTENTTNTGMIFDTANPTGGDSDLVTPGYGVNNIEPQGKALIASEDGSQSNPDDDASGAVFTFTSYDAPRYIHSIDFVDIEEDGGTIVLMNWWDSVLNAFNIAGLGDNSYQRLSVDQDLVKTIKITLTGSGAIDNLIYSIALPIEIQSFTGYQKQKKIILSWKVHGEFTGFELDELTTGDKIKTDKTTYEFEPKKEAVYNFRLTAIDKDGTLSYSDILPIPFRLKDVQVQRCDILGRKADDMIQVTDKIKIQL